MDIRKVGQGSVPQEPQNPGEPSSKLKKCVAHVSEVVKDVVVTNGRAKIKHPAAGPLNSTAIKTDKFVQS